MNDVLYIVFWVEIPTAVIEMTIVPGVAQGCASPFPPVSTIISSSSRSSIVGPTIDSKPSILILSAKTAVYAINTE